MYIIYSIILIAVIFVLLCWKNVEKKHRNKRKEQDAEVYYDKNIFTEAESSLHDGKYRSKILPEDQLDEYISKPFYLSIEQDYDCFFIMTERDGKIHSTEDLVFYNSEYAYYPFMSIEGDDAICSRIKKKFNDTRFNCCPCSKDGSIIIESDSCFPDYAGHKIDLTLVDKKISKIFVVIGEYPFNKQVISSYTLRLSREMIYWQEEDYGFNKCFYFENTILDKDCILNEICSFERNVDGSWHFSKESNEYSSFDEILKKYDSII